MFKKSLCAFILASASCHSMANWVVGADYANLSFEPNDSVDLNFDLLVASFGYEFELMDNFKLVPEYRLGTGINDDSYAFEGSESGIHVDLQRFTAVSTRIQYDFESGLYLFANPSYGNAKRKSSVVYLGQPITSTHEDWEFSFGAGIGFHFNDAISAQLMMERYDESDLISAGVRFAF